MELKDLNEAEREMLALIAASPLGPQVGLDVPKLSVEQQDTWLGLFTIGLVDEALDSAGTSWMILTDRGMELWKTGSTN